MFTLNHKQSLLFAMFSILSLYLIIFTWTFRDESSNFHNLLPNAGALETTNR